MEIDTSSSGREYGIRPAGFRLPDRTRVGAVRLQVSDLERSLDYYQGVLGFRVQDASSGHAMLGPQADVPPLVELRTERGVARARRSALGLYHFAILLPDRAALGRFAAQLSTVRERVGMADHLVSEAFYLWDPDGLGIEVYADRPRDTWRHRDRQLVMATDPLDVESVIAAGGGKAWTGMPPGTTIGHMHLHVGTLEEAEAFYHAAVGLEKMVWTYPGALFLAAGGYHHHLGTNIWSPGPPATENEARLLEWELVVPEREDAVAALENIRSMGYRVDDGDAVADPWGTRLRIVAAHD